MTIKGVRFSKEHRRKLSEAHKRSESCKQHLKKLHQSSKGKHYSPATEFRKGHLFGYEHRFKKGDTRGHRFKKGNTGEKCPAWKGGKVRHGQGYILIYVPGHPYSSDRHNYILEHRLVMEKHIGRYLLPTEIVHHINEIRNDNRLENLMLFPNIASHLAYHRKNVSPWPGIQYRRSTNQ